MIGGWYHRAQVYAQILVGRIHVQHALAGEREDVVLDHVRHLVQPRPLWRVDGMARDPIDQVVANVDVAGFVVEIDAFPTVAVGVDDRGVGRVVDLVVPDTVAGRRRGGRAGLDTNRAAVIHDAL